MIKLSLSIFLTVLFVPLFAAAQAAEDAAGETFRVKNSLYSFELKERDGKCVLSYAKKGVAKELPLDVSASCKVIRNSGKTNLVKQFYYRDLKATAIMIGGGVARGKCGEEATRSTQIVLIGKTGIKAGKKLDRETCLPDGPDEKDYWLDAHP